MFISILRQYSTTKGEKIKEIQNENSDDWASGCEFSWSSFAWKAFESLMTFSSFLGKSFGKEMQAFTRQISHVIMSQNSIFSPVSWVVVLLREMGHLCTEGPLEAFDCLVPRSIFCRCFVVPSIPSSLFGHLLLLWKLGDYCWIPFLKRLQSPFMLLYLHTINFYTQKV